MSQRRGALMGYVQRRPSLRRAVAAVSGLALIGSTFALTVAPGRGRAHRPPEPVTLVGSLQSELGCPGDWQPGVRRDAPRGDRHSRVSSRPSSPCPRARTSTRWRSTEPGTRAMARVVAPPTSRWPLASERQPAVRLQPRDTHRDRRSGGSAAASVGRRPRARGQQPAHRTSRKERFYFVMADRFANGDPANDTGGIAGGRSARTATTRRAPASTTAATLRGCSTRSSTSTGLARRRSG